MSTIAAALAEHVVPREEIARRYPGPTGLVSRILGVVPNSSGVLEIWPPALVTVNLSVPALFDVPRCDVGFGISPRTRALVAHASSRAFGCNYCTAHTAIMGTLVRGPTHAPKVEERVRQVGDPTSAEPADAAAIRYGLAIGQMPTPPVAAAMKQLQDHCTPRELEAVVLAAVNMGLLNRVMDTLGIPLETAVESTAERVLEAEAGWSAGQHSQGAGARPDEGEVLALPPRLRMLREIPAAVGYTKRALAEVPSGKAKQRELLQAHLGFVPYWLDTVQSAEVRRLFVHYLIERMSTEGVDDGVGPGLKATMGWLHARAAGNVTLAGHFAFMALRAGVPREELRAAADPASGLDSAALELARATSGGASVLAEGLVEELVASHSPAGLIELVMVLSIVTALHRYTHSFPPAQPETEITELAARHGEALLRA